MMRLRMLAPTMFALLNLVGCGDGGVQSPDFTPVLRALSMSNASGSSIPAGRSLNLTATGEFTNPPGSPTPTETRSVSASFAVDDATVARIEGSNLIGLRIGSVSVTASYDGQSSAPIVINVTAAVLEQIVVTPANPTIPSGQSQEFTAMGVYSDSDTPRAIDEVVSWVSSRPAVATVTTPGNTSTATSPQTGSGQVPNPNTTTITASATNSEANVISGTATLTISAPIFVSLSGIAPLNPSVALGRTQGFSATGLRSDGSSGIAPNGQLSWSSQFPQTIASIDANGVATTISLGSTDITATLTAFPGQTQSTTLTVTDPVLTAIVITPEDPTIPMLSSVSLQAMGIFTDSATPRPIATTVNWVSDTPTTVFVAPPTGSSTTAQGLSPGEAAVTASTVNIENVPITGSVTVTVEFVLPLSMSLIAPASTDPQLRSTGPVSETLSVGESSDFTAYGVWADGLSRPLANQALDWTVSAPSIVETDENGTATGLSQGQSEIRARFKDGQAEDASPRDAAASVEVTP